MAFSTQRQFFYFPTYYDDDECRVFNCIKLRSYDTDERAWNWSEGIKSQFLVDKVSRIINEYECENHQNSLRIIEDQGIENTEETVQEDYINQTGEIGSEKNYDEQENDTFNNYHKNTDEEVSEEFRKTEPKIASKEQGVKGKLNKDNIENRRDEHQKTYTKHDKEVQTIFPEHINESKAVQTLASKTVENQDTIQKRIQTDKAVQTLIPNPKSNQQDVDSNSSTTSTPIKIHQMQVNKEQLSLKSSTDINSDSSANSISDDSSETDMTMPNDYRNSFLIDLKKVLHCLLSCKLRKNTKDMLVRIDCQAETLVRHFEQKFEHMNSNENCKQKCKNFYEELEYKSDKSADIQEQVDKLRCEFNLLQNQRREENMESTFRNMFHDQKTQPKHTNYVGSFHDQLNALDKKNEACQELDQQIEDLRSRALRAKLIVEDSIFASENEGKIKNIKINTQKQSNQKFSVERIDSDNCPVYTVRDMEMEKQNLEERHVMQIEQLQSSIINLEMELNKYKAELSVTKCEAKIESDKYNDLMDYFKQMQQMK